MSWVAGGEGPSVAEPYWDGGVHVSQAERKAIPLHQGSHTAESSLITLLPSLAGCRVRIVMKDGEASMVRCEGPEGRCQEAST